MVKHWVVNLPEVGRPFLQKGEDIDRLRERVQALRDEAHDLELIANNKADDLYRKAQEFWTLKEIEGAMA